ISSCNERVGESAENAGVVVMNLTGLSVHQHAMTMHTHAVHLADGLMSEADTQNGDRSPKGGDEFGTDSRFVGGAWTGRNQQACRLKRDCFFNRDFVVPNKCHLNRRVKLADPLDQVVRE